ncbi:hypothetical protein K466DRAFT_445702, partial [Polyporus arcularius HHB13444]
TLQELHARLGHISPAVAKRMVEQGRIRGVKLTGGSADETCEVCVQAKIARVPVPSERTSDLAKRYGDHIHANTW